MGHLQAELVPEQSVLAPQRYTLPGNVRELQHLIERTVILSPGKRLELW